jgi:hypothetical protein
MGDVVLKDKCGEFTFLSHLGKSVIDYIAVSSDLFGYVCDVDILNIDASDHSPLSCSFLIPARPATYTAHDAARHVRYRWNDTCKYQLNDNTTDNLVTEFFNVLPSTVNAAVNCICDILYHAGAWFRCTQRGGNSNDELPTWWDGECEVAKRNKYSYLNTFRMSNAVIYLDLYKDSKNKFKALCKNKKSLYQQSLARDMCCTNANPNDLWRNVKRFIRRNQTDCPIPSDVWVNYFQGILSDAKFVVDEQFYADVSEYLKNVEHAESVLKKS